MQTLQNAVQKHPVKLSVGLAINLAGALALLQQI